MVCRRAFLVGSGHLPDRQMRRGAKSLIEVWGGNLVEFSCNQNPRDILDSLTPELGLVQLLGDSAIHYPEWGSWLEALAAWQQPTILIVAPSDSGEVPGLASAYTALCESLSVPLLGIVQIGGDWSPLQRRSDGLPWCGHLPDNVNLGLSDDGKLSESNERKIQEVVCLLRRRIIELKL